MRDKCILLVPEGGSLNRQLQIEGDTVEVGDHTGRCYECGSRNLWDDMTAYGCKDCKWVRFTGELSPAAKREP